MYIYHSSNWNNLNFFWFKKESGRRWKEEQLNALVYLVSCHISIRQYICGVHNHHSDRIRVIFRVPVHSYEPSMQLSVPTRLKVV